MPAKSVKSMKSTGSKKGKDVKFAPSQADYTQPLIVKNSKVTFGNKLEQVKVQHKDRLEDLIMEMDAVKKENGRLRQQQEDTYGVSADTVQRMKQELERARTTRMFLLEDINIRKAKSEKMEADIFELNMKLESCMKKINEYNRMRGEWEDTSEKLTKMEDKCEKLVKVNKNLRMLLIKHHIDPKTVDFGSARSKKSSQSVKSPKKSILKQETPKQKPSAHMMSHSYTHVGKNSDRLSRSLDDIQSYANVDDGVKKKNAMTSKKAMGRGPPSYLGYYTNIYQNKLVSKAKHESVHLPRLVVA